MSHIRPKFIAAISTALVSVLSLIQLYIWLQGSIVQKQPYKPLDCLVGLARLIWCVSGCITLRLSLYNGKQHLQAWTFLRIIC